MGERSTRARAVASDREAQGMDVEKKEEKRVLLC